MEDKKKKPKANDETQKVPHWNTGNKYALGNNGGQPTKFETPEDLILKIEEYFDKAPVGSRTITGLALHIGFESRQSFYDYEKKDKFAYIIKRARLYVEESYEIRLYGNNPTGAIFALKNMNWSDKQQIDHTTNGNDITPTVIKWGDKEIQV